MPNGSGSPVESRNLLGGPAQWASALLYRVCPRKAIPFFEHVRPSLQFLMPLFLLMWAIERWILLPSSFLLVAFVVWATLQYGNFQHQILAEELKKKWVHLLLNSSPTTPLESCQWLNKLLVQVWPNVVAPKLSKHFSAVVQVTIKLVLRGWQFADDSNNFEKSTLSSEMTTGGSRQLSPTGRKLKVTIIEGRNLALMGRSGMSNTYVKLQYGKVLYQTRTLSHDVDPIWNQSFEFNEIGGGEYLKVTCYSSDIFGDDTVGSAKINLEGLTEDSTKDIWIPLERVNTGELRIQIEQVKDGDVEESQSKIGGREAGVIELVLIEAKNLVAADLSGTSDPYVKILYGDTHRKSQVVHKTLNPQWNQKFEFLDTKSHLELHVKDHNVVLPASNLGKCIIECNSLLPNVTLDKWIPLQGAEAGEIHVQVTRKVREQQVQTSVQHDFSVSSKALQMSLKVQEVVKKFHVLVDNEDLDGISMALNEIQKMEEEQEKYMLQLEREKNLLLGKISELAKEINHAVLASPTL